MSVDKIPEDEKSHDELPETQILAKFSPSVASKMVNIDVDALPYAVLFLLLAGGHDDEILQSSKQRSAISDSEGKRKKVKLQTYIRATTLEEYIEIERTEENGTKTYKVEARIESLIAPEKHVEHIKGDNLKISLETSNLSARGISSFKITGKTPPTSENGADITFDLPEEVKLEGDYKMTGTLFDREVNGIGTTDITIKGVSLSGLIDVTDNEKELLIKNLILTYTFKDIGVKFTNLRVKGIDQGIIEAKINEVAAYYFKKNSRQISARLANEIKSRVNRKLKGMTGVKILSVLKSI